MSQLPLHKLGWRSRPGQRSFRSPEGSFDFASQTADIELFCSQLSRNSWCLVICWAPVRAEAEPQPIIRTYWRCLVWCTAAKGLHSLLWTIPRKSTVCDHKSTLPPDSLDYRLLDLRQHLSCRLTKEQKWQLLFDRNWRSLAPSSQTKWLVYLRKWKVTFCYPDALHARCRVVSA